MVAIESSVSLPASARNWPKQISSGQHRIRTCDLYGVNVAL